MRQGRRPPSCTSDVRAAILSDLLLKMNRMKPFTLEMVRGGTFIWMCGLTDPGLTCVVRGNGCIDQLASVCHLRLVGD